MGIRAALVLFAAGALALACGCSCGSSHERPDGGPDDAGGDALASDAGMDAAEAADAAPSARWRWSHPLPEGNSLDAVWGAGPGDVWAVGGGGALLHFDGASWAAVPSGTTRDLHGLWGSGPDDVWAVGGESFWTLADDGTGILLHWDGASWSSVEPGSRGLFAVWGTSPTDVWAVGYQTILHFDGAAWTPQAIDAPYALYSVWAAAPDDAWAVGDYGPVLHYDGSTWTAMPSGIEGIGVTGAVWGLAADDVWTSSLIRGLSHWDGTAWSAPESTGVVSFGGTASNDVWGVAGGIVHFDGVDWTVSPTPVGAAVVRGVWASATNDAWAVGDAGTILHFDGTAWTSWSPIAPSVRFEGVWASAEDDVWAVGWEQRLGSGGALDDYGVVYHRDATGWARAASVTVGPSYSQHFEDVWGSAPDDVWAVGGDGMILHFDGDAWSPVDSGTFDRIDGIWGTSADDVWTAGYLGVQHWDGTAWTTSDATPYLGAVWASAPDDVWVVGDYGMVRHFDGTGWSTVAVDALAGIERPLLRAIWGSGPDDFWIAAGVIPPGMVSVTSGLLVHRVGTTWTSTPSAQIESLWGSGPSDVWAIGDHAMHYDGTAWTEVSEPPLGVVSLYDVSGRNAEDVWAVGSAAIVLHRSP